MSDSDLHFEPVDVPEPAAQPIALRLSDDPHHWLGVLLDAHGITLRRNRVAICNLLDRATDDPTPRVANVVIELYRARKGGAQ